MSRSRRLVLATGTGLVIQVLWLALFGIAVSWIILLYINIWPRFCGTVLYQNCCSLREIVAVPPEGEGLQAAGFLSMSRVSLHLVALCLLFRPIRVGLGPTIRSIFSLSLTLSRWLGMFAIQLTFQIFGFLSCGIIQSLYMVQFPKLLLYNRFILPHLRYQRRILTVALAFPLGAVPIRQELDLALQFSLNQIKFFNQRNLLLLCIKKQDFLFYP